MGRRCNKRTKGVHDPRAEAAPRSEAPLWERPPWGGLSEVGVGKRAGAEWDYEWASWRDDTLRRRTSPLLSAPRSLLAGAAAGAERSDAVARASFRLCDGAAAAWRSHCAMIQLKNHRNTPLRWTQPVVDDNDKVRY